MDSSQRVVVKDPRGGVAGAVAAVEQRVIAWRRDIHQNPELSNREFRTSALVARHLEALGFEVKTGIAHTGVTGVLRGGHRGPTIGLRADMDALPVTEAVDVPFASRVRAQYEGQEVGVMHACGHDAHTAILMGVAEVLASMRDQLRGAVKLIFQPAEEGPPKGERGGAELMVAEGVLDDPKLDAVFGLHVTSRLDTGAIGYRAGALMAAVDTLRIVVRGRQTHGAYPWYGVDPVVVAAQIVIALQTIPSRQLDVTVAPAVVTIGIIRGGVRSNIIPETVELIGTVRSLDEKMRAEIHTRIMRTASGIAESAGASAEVSIERGYPITFNDPQLTGRILPSLQRAAGSGNLVEVTPVLGAEDFAFYQQRIPGVFFLVGVRPKGSHPEETAPNHSPHFFVDEAALRIGVAALTEVAVDYLYEGD